MTSVDQNRPLASPTGITGPTRYATYAFQRGRFDAYLADRRVMLGEQSLSDALTGAGTGILLDREAKRAVIVSDFAPVEREDVEFLKAFKSEGFNVVAVARHAQHQRERFGAVLIDDVARRFLLESNRFVDGVIIQTDQAEASEIYRQISEGGYGLGWIQALETAARDALEPEPMVTVTSGYFNPPQPGTFAMFMEAWLRTTSGGHIVIANNDMQVWLKKGLSGQMVGGPEQHIMRPAVDRQAMAEANRYISRVAPSIDGNRSVVQTLSRLIEEHRETLVEFDNGGDRRPDADPIPEAVIENRYPGRARVQYNVGGAVERALVAAGMQVEDSGPFIKSGSSTAFNRALGLEVA